MSRRVRGDNPQVGAVRTTSSARVRRMEVVLDLMVGVRAFLEGEGDGGEYQLIALENSCIPI